MIPTQTRRWLAALAAALALTLPATVRGDTWIDWRSKDNLAVVNASGIEKEYVLTAASQPGGLFYPGEPCEVTLAVPEKPAEPIDGGWLELVGVHNRNAAPGEVGFVLVTRAPKVLRTVEKPVRVPAPPRRAGEKTMKVVLPLPEHYGTFMLLLERKGGKRTFIGSVARVHRPTPRKGEFPQIMAESGVSNWSRLGDAAGGEHLAAVYQRMGIGLVRWEFHWSQDGPGKPYRWDFIDQGIPACARHGIKLMNTMGAQPGWTLPFGGPTPAALNMIDFVCMPRHDADYGRWVRAFVERYWSGGQSGLWAIEHWNEPWEPVSCAGWQSDSNRYRALLEVLSREAHAAAPGIKIAAACSVMNTEDKLASDGSAERMKWIDLMTDHYVTPCCSYGARVAARHGRVSGETETWGVCTEVLLPQFMTQFLAIGNRWINPMTGDMPLEELGGKDHPLLTPKPLAVAVDAWNAIIADRPFRRIAFTRHLPWLFQFGPDDDARLVLYGRAMPLASGNVRDLVWRQAAEGPDGTIAIVDPQGALVVMDMEGNRLAPEGKTYRLPMSPTAFYLQSDRGAAYAIQCVRQGKLEGLRRVEIIPGTLAALPAAGKPAELAIRVHNLRNAALSGELRVESLLKDFPVRFAEKLEMEAGETATATVPITRLPAGGLPLRFVFQSPGGQDVWQEVVRPTVVARGTMPLDGDLAAWSKAPAVVVIRPEGNDAGNVIERAWLPFLEKRGGAAPARHGEVRMAWDDQNLYVMAAVESDPPQPKQRLETWDQEQYFYSAKTDPICEMLRPFEKYLRERPGDPGDAGGRERWRAKPEYARLQQFLKEHPEAAPAVEAGAPGAYFNRKAADPKASCASASHVYIKDFAPDQPFAGDNFQFAFDLDPAEQWPAATHDLKYPDGVLPDGFQCLPDSDYEFSLYNCRDGRSELFCLLSPGMPRVHVMPRQPRGKIYPHAVKEARSTVVYQGGRAIYRVALPWKSLGIERPRPGMDFGFVFRFNASKGDRTEFGVDMASTKSNSLSLHPYWSAGPSCTVRWTLEP